MPGSELTGFFFYQPVYWDAALSLWQDPEGCLEVITAWAIPVTTSEIAFIAAQGWTAFKDVVEEAQPDLFDLHRAPVA